MCHSSSVWDCWSCWKASASILRVELICFQHSSLSAPGSTGSENILSLFQVKYVLLEILYHTSTSFEGRSEIPSLRGKRERRQRHNQSAIWHLHDMGFYNFSTVCALSDFFCQKCSSLLTSFITQNKFYNSPPWHNGEDSLGLNWAFSRAISWISWREFSLTCWKGLHLQGASSCSRSWAFLSLPASMLQWPLLR